MNTYLLKVCFYLSICITGIHYCNQILWLLNWMHSVSAMFLEVLKVSLQCAFVCVVIWIVCVCVCVCVSECAQLYTFHRFIISHTNELSDGSTEGSIPWSTGACSGYPLPYIVYLLQEIPQNCT